MVENQLHVPVTEAGPSGSGNQYGNQYGSRYQRGGIEDVVEVELHLHEIERPRSGQVEVLVVNKGSN